MPLFKLLVLCLFLSACTTSIDYHMPTNRFETPEVAGDTLAGKAAIHSTSSHKVTAAEAFDCIVFSCGSVDTDELMEKRHVHLGGSAHLGLLSKLDVFLRKNLDSPAQFGLKFQALGSGKIAAEEGHKLSFAASYGESSEEDKTITVTSTSGASREYKTNEEIAAYDFMTHYGYRLDPEKLVYLGGYYSRYKIEGLMSSTEFSNVDVLGRSKSYGVLLGGEFTTANKLGSIIVETGYAVGKYLDEAKLNNFTVGLALGINWD